jgi:hypothetical protein
MRTDISVAASPLAVLCHGIFSTKTYTAQTPIVWQHLFLSDTQMTNWSEGSSLFLAWVVGKEPTLKASERPAPPITALSGSLRIRHPNHVGAHVGKSSPPA